MLGRFQIANNIISKLFRSFFRNKPYVHLHKQLFFDFVYKDLRIKKTADKGLSLTECFTGFI